ncbi:helix-turn-helix domain-containing protein [Tateyamaria omphalii]|uniref:helix-turn-helix domain-containing protein n=1 Tax=Tateyamaria omphalii TaxID=299262 RepID=UPI0028F6EF78|nr:helix-turn-helix domain-containing protein [Tateyamaria omphalii]
MPKSKSDRITEICKVIEADISAPLRTDMLARAAGMAQHHFQRQFAAATGETVAGYIRSRRLERAAITLQETTDRVIDIALDAGFQTHAAFTRAFTAHFECSPSVFRKNGLPLNRQGLPPRPFLRPLSSRTLTARCDLIEVPRQWLCCRKNIGLSDGRFFQDLDAVSAEFQALRTELGTHTGYLATAFPQGPKGFSDPKAEAYYGAVMQDRCALDWPAEWRLLPAGLFAVFPHFGSLTTLHLTWHRCVRSGFDQLGVRFRSAWMYETYFAPNAETNDTELSALIYLPVEKSTDGTA